MKKRFARIKDYIILLTIQLLIITLFLTAIHQRKQIKYTDTVKATFVADKIVEVNIKAFARHTLTKKYIHVFYGGIKYKIDLLYNLDYTKKELIDKMSGQEITILYEKGTNYIVELQINGLNYFTLDDYNSEQRMQLTFGVVIFIILQTLFMGVLALYLIVFEDILNPRKKTGDKKTAKHRGRW